MGEKFGRAAQAKIQALQSGPDWQNRRKLAEGLLNFTKKFFPHYIDELQAYAEGAKVNFLDLWTASLEDELDQKMNKCTTAITNGGKLIAHNEDWYRNLEESVCLLLKKTGDLAVFELYYFNTLGGNAVGINSNGFAFSVNSLNSKNGLLGVPRNVIARWLSETKNPDADFKKMQKIPRSSGYNFNIVNRQGKIWNIESTAQEAVLNNSPSPFVHTNHYLSELKREEISDNSTGTFDRYEVAKLRAKNQMSVSELIDLTNDHSRGDILSVMNERTIAKMIIDLNELKAEVWLKREAGRGWIKYRLDKLFGL